MSFVPAEETTFDMTCMSFDQMKSLLDRLMHDYPPTLFKDWARQWLETYQRGRVKGNTFVGNYWEPVELHLIPYFGDHLLTEIHPIDVAAFFKEQRDRYTVETQKKMRISLSNIFDAAIENGLCEKNPVTKSMKLSSQVPPKEKHAWTRQQYDIALDFARRGDYLDIMVLLETGISRSELLGLTWQNFDSEHKVLYLTDGLVQMKDSETNRLILVHDGLKNQHRKRGVPISTEITQRLLSMPRVIYVGGDKHRHTEPRRVELEFIFHAPEGGPYCPSNWYHRRFKSFMRELRAVHPEIPPITPHEFRHTCASVLRERGVDLYSIAKLLGHADLEMLGRRYLHTDLEALRHALNLDDQPESE